MDCKAVADAASSRKTAAELEQEIALIERIAASLREQLETARWREEYDKAE